MFRIETIFSKGFILMRRSLNSLLLFISIFSAIFLGQAFAVNYTPHEKNFYKTQIRSIKKSWQNLIKNESIIMLDTDSLLKKGRFFLNYEKEFKNCQSWKDYEVLTSKLSQDLAEIERESFDLLSKLNQVSLDQVEKAPTTYTLFVKRISEINQKISEIRLFTIDLSDKKDTTSSWQMIKIQNSADFGDLVDRLDHLVDTFPQITLKSEMKDLLSLGQTEFINTLSENISDTMIGNYHKMDIVFNSINRDLLKTENLLSAGSKGHLIRIHQRWNAILKIVKRK